LTQEDRELAGAHWAYTEKIIDHLLNLVECAYIEAFIHGMKHGRELEAGV
jgi:hypothetical protein